MIYQQIHASLPPYSCLSARRALHRARRHVHGSRASSVAGDRPRSGGEGGGEQPGPSGGLRRGLTCDSGAQSLPGCRSDDEQS